MAADGSIKIEIEVDGKEVKVASKELDNLEASAGGVGKGIKAAESSMDGLADSSAKASKDVKSAADSVDGLADSGSKASKDLKGADGAIDGIADSSTQAASSVRGVGDSLDQVGDKASKTSDQLGKTSEETEKVGKQAPKASIGLKDLAVSLGLVAVASAAFNTLKSSMDSAIARFDTLNSFPKVLQALGVSAEDSEAAMSKLSDGIDGLPTTLNDIAASAQRMYTSFNDMDMAADTAIALNNAMLGSGSNAEQASRGVDQYTKALQTGKIQMDTWNTLSETMDVGLIKIAEGFGYAGKSAKDDLYQALQNGTVTLDEFNAKLIEVGTGTGVMAELAKENSLGIATSLGNLKNAAARGIANIIESFDKLSQEVTGKDIAQNIDSLKAVVNASFKTMGAAVEGTAPVFVAFGSTVKTVLPVVNALTPAIVGLMVAYGTYAVISKAAGVINASNAILAVATASNKALMIATMASATASGADAAAKAAQGGAISIVTLAIGVMTGSIKLSTAAQIIGTTASYAFGAAIRFMMGPIGWVITGIGLLVTGVVALVKWFNKSTEEAKRMTEETDNMVSSVESLTSSVKSSSDAYEENQSSIGATAKANEDLAQKIQTLSEKEQKSAADKLLLAEYVEQLNGSIEGLNLAYNEEANALNMSSEQLGERLQLMQDLETSAAGQERLLEISEEQHEVDMQLSEVNELRQEWMDKLEAGEVKAKEAAAGIAELDEQERTLTETNAELSQQYAITSEQITESLSSVASATQDSVSLQLEAFASLSDGNRQLVDDMMSKWQEYQDAATDMFDKLTDKPKTSISEMQTNLEENQRIIGEWADNIAKLSERGIDEGLLETLRAAGPESAGHVKELVNSSDTELQKLSDTFANGGEVATDALSKSLGIGGTGVAEAVGDLVENTTSTMKQKIEASDFNAVGQSIPEDMKSGIESGAPDTVDAAVKMADDTMKETKSALGTNSPSKEFTTIGESVPEGMTLGINNGTPKAIEAAKKLATELLKPFDKTPADFRDIANNAMLGFNEGLNNRRGQVLATARSIANQVAQTMRKALDIHSPSRVTRKIGNETGEGLNLGLKDQQNNVSATSEKMAKTVIGLIEKMNKSIQLDTTKHNAEIKQIEKRAKEDINAINVKAAKDKRKLTEAEVIRIRRINEDASKKIVSIEEKISKEREKIAIDSSKELIRIAEDYVQKKKFNGEMSLKDEGHFWNQMYKNVEYGSEEYEKAMQNHQNVVKRMRDQMESTNESYAKRIIEIDRKLVEDTKKLNQEYTDAYKSKLNDLLGFAGLFDEFVETEDITGQKLTDNLLSQVTALQEFSMVIRDLEFKVDNAELFAELEAMGPSAIAELKALNNMSSKELEKFTNLYQQKFNLARNQTIKELEPLKNSIEKQIKELNKASQKELETVRKEWIEVVNKIILGTEKEFDSMRQVGIDAAEGLEKGLLSRESKLVGAAKQIANSVQNAIKSALEIRSPSRLMRDEVGKMIPLGIAIGIEDNADSVYKTLKNMSRKMIAETKPEVALGNISSHRINAPMSSLGGNSRFGNPNNASQPNDDILIENILMIDSYELGRALSGTISTEQAGAYSIRSIIRGG